MANCIKHDLIQRTPQWHAHRKKTLGASEISAVMGFSPHTSTYDLWEEKRGIGAEKEPNWAMDQGIKKEPEIKAFYEHLMGCNTVDMTITYPEWNVASASLDAIEYDPKTGKYGDVIAEFKYPSQKIVDGAKLKKLPLHYYAQVQWQLMVSGASKGYLLAYKSPDNYGLVEVQPDVEYQTKMLEAAKDFWVLVELGTPPEKPKDSHVTATDNTFLELEQELMLLKEKYDNMKSEFEEKKRALIEAADSKNTKGKYFTITEKKSYKTDWQAVESSMGISKSEVDRFKTLSSVSFEVRTNHRSSGGKR